MLEPSPEIEPDGLDTLRKRIGVKAIMGWIEATARWVDPNTFRLMPVWYPEHARGALFYKANWTLEQMNKNKASQFAVHKREGNRYASLALSAALGLKPKDRPNWSCCHIWGVDDDKFQKGNAVVRDRRFYSCVGNMVLLPTPLKAFTDSMPEVKAMIRLCARNLYDWYCDHESLPNESRDWEIFSDWANYPASWPRTPNEQKPQGVVAFTPSIGATAKKRLETIWHDLGHAGYHYPRAEVQAAMQYWELELASYSNSIDRPPLTNDPSRFSGTASDIVSLGKAVEITDLTTTEQRLRNLEHDASMEEIKVALPTSAAKLT